MYNHNKAQQSKNRVHISWDILYMRAHILIIYFFTLQIFIVNYTQIVHNEYYFDLILQYRCTIAII